MRIILDGGMGRELKRVGAPFRQPEWSSLALTEAPEQVVAVHRSFIEAGADVITTNNYAVVPHHIGDDRFRKEGAKLTALAGKLAREAAGSGVRVGGSLPPLSGSYRADLFDAALAATAYPVIVDALEPFVDIWQAETISSLEEAKAVSAAVARSDKPLWLSFTLTDDIELPEPCLRSGESLESALSLATEVGAQALLFNCSLPEVIGQAIQHIGPLRQKNAPALLLGGYGNTFTPRPSDAQANADVASIREEVTPQQYAQLTRDWEGNGATIIGGCCGIGPEHIAALCS